MRSLQDKGWYVLRGTWAECESKDMDTSNETLVKQLRSIKNLLALGVVGLFGLVGANIYYIVDDVREN
jgi:hypothetical protein